MQAQRAVARSGRLAVAVAMAAWGTWEELVLGGAVVRYGAAAWDTVAAEVRARTPFPDLFTPQECEAKYEDLQKRYSDAWYEELRKQRVADLKRALEKSEESIGSLQSKIESLNAAERASASNVEYKTNQKESLSLSGNADGIDSSSRHLSKDGSSSAGSLTAEADRDRSSRCQLLPSASPVEHNLKTEMSEHYPDQKKPLVGILKAVQACFKKKRGKRKRKVYVLREGSTGGNDLSTSALHTDRQEKPSEACDQEVRQPSEEAHKCVQGEDAKLNLEGIMHSIMEDEAALVFQRRLENQKREGKKKMIPQHVDLRSISSRITDASISSAKELFGELLLLSNNALGFYRKNSIGYKSALTFRDLVNKTLQQGSQCSPQVSGDGSIELSTQPGKPKKRLVAMRACNQNIPSCKGSKTPTVKSKKVSHPDIPAVSSDKKRKVGRPVKNSKGSSKRQQETPTKGRKRTRIR